MDGDEDHGGINVPKDVEFNEAMHITDKQG